MYERVFSYVFRSVSYMRALLKFQNLQFRQLTLHFHVVRMFSYFLR